MLVKLKLVVLALPLASGTLGSLIPRAEMLPMYDGFPSPSPSQLHQIEVYAGGLIPNSAPPKSLSPASQDSIRFLGFLEALSAAFYDQLEYNLTTSQPGFTESEYVTNITELALNVRQFRSVQEVHGLTGAAIANATGIQGFNGCPEYIFPLTNLSQSISFADTLQSATLGAVGDVAQAAANNGDTGLIRTLVAIAGAEGMQQAYWNTLMGISPDNVPFATQFSRQFFVSYFAHAVPDPTQCPNLTSLIFEPFPPIPPLGVVSLPEPSDQDGTFTLFVESSQWMSNETYYGVTLNQVSLPIVQNITNVDNVMKDRQNFTTFQLNYPYSENLLNGFVVLAITNSPGPFADVDAVTNATAFGPLPLVQNMEPTSAV